MASSNYTHEQQREIIKNKINGMLNSDMKEICKAYGYQVSGVKTVLQKRCQEILDTVGQQGGPAFAEFEYRVVNHGRAPTHGLSASSSSGHGRANRVSAMYQQAAPAKGRSLLANVRSPVVGITFKPSPFYEILATVLHAHDLPDAVEMPQNRHTVNARLALNPDQVQLLRDNRNIRLLLYCGTSSSLSSHNQAEITFPSQLEVRINSDDLKHGYKGLKNKSGSTKPADITDKIRKNPGYQNQISVTYALTKERYSFVIYIARHVSADRLIERIRTGRVIPKQTVLDEMNRANADPDIAATSVRMSLKDPISCCRISLPVRSTVCTHNQCFDGGMFLQLQEQAPQWNCPVCNKNIPFESLCIDKYFEDILQRTSSSIEKIDIEPNGEWMVIKEEEDAQTNGSSRKRPRASYDDDFDDDEPVMLAEPSPHPVNGSSSNLRTTSSATPAMARTSLNASPVQSREPSVAQSTASTHRPSSKRTASAVIDLTISDDDDEPPRPAKRQSTSMHHRDPSLPLHPPPSLLRPLPLSEHRSTSQSGHTDMYRTSHGAERAPGSGRISTTNPTGQPYSIVNGDTSLQGQTSNLPSFSRHSGGTQTFPSQAQPRPSASSSARNEPPTFSSLSLRPPGTPVREQQQQEEEEYQSAHKQHSKNALRLPSVQQVERGAYHDGWRNDYANYSSSPQG